VLSALFENNVFLMGQHMLQFAMTGKQPAPMPARDNPWAVYDVFTVKDGEQIFLAAVSDAQWQSFCDVLGLPDLKADPALATNNQRVKLREPLLKTLRERLAPRSAAELADVMERAGLPFAPIRRPEDLLDDPHLLATGGLADVVVADGDMAGKTVKTTLFPITMDGARLGVAPASEGTASRVRVQPPKIAEHTDALMASIGYKPEQIRQLRAQDAVA
jgi:crotonobetainyl-CoA:carnitine CoA-transferase CaiB-like acyl-CoA transferase